MRIKRRHSEAADSATGIDLAPMLDFVTNLLIFFIITAVFIKEAGLDVNRPDAIQQPKNTDTKSIQIQILDDGEVWVDNRVVDVAAVRANVERLSAVSPKSGVLVIATPNAPTGKLVQVVDQVHQGGIYNITFTTSQ